jgi:hypothetical protein
MPAEASRSGQDTPAVRPSIAWTVPMAWCPCRVSQVGLAIVWLRAAVERLGAFAGDHLSGDNEDQVSSAA